MSSTSKILFNAAIAATLAVSGMTAAGVSAGPRNGKANCDNAHWNHATQRCGISTGSGYHYTTTDRDDATGLLVLGGLLAGGVLLHSIFSDDGDGDASLRVHHTTTHGYGHGQRYGHKHGHGHGNGHGRAKRKARRACGAVASYQAQQAGYENAVISGNPNLKQKGHNHWVMRGELTVTYNQRVRGNAYRNSYFGNRQGGYRGNQWGGQPFNAGWNDRWDRGFGRGFYQPRFITKTEQRAFKCRVRDGEVRSFSLRSN